ncbi:Uncharacterised protein [Mycobacteroides abscessus subsp. abscessus]|nr:Uncharacterised protein [Mycobacteroides abscessus subsp. abscessus]
MRSISIQSYVPTSTRSSPNTPHPAYAIPTMKTPVWTVIQIQTRPGTMFDRSRSASTTHSRPSAGRSCAPANSAITVGCR